jgi:7-carboxy-7-deazaguanine synthase
MSTEALSPSQRTALESGLMLPVMEQFYTVQGEGFHTGRAAYFIRIGGCDVGCHWCDVKESWDASRHPLTEIGPIIAQAVAQPSDTVVITGGEPLMYNLGPLTEALHLNGLKVHIETSGAYPASGRLDWICLSPKKTMPPLDGFHALAHELKVIVHNRDDIRWAESHAAQVNSNCILYLQPEWSRSGEMMPVIADHVMNNPRWRISLQTHKYIGIP